MLIARDLVAPGNGFRRFLIGLAHATKSIFYAMREILERCIAQLALSFFGLAEVGKRALVFLETEVIPTVSDQHVHPASDLHRRGGGRRVSPPDSCRCKLLSREH